MTGMAYFGVEPPDDAFPLSIPDVAVINTSLPMGTRTPTFTKGNTMVDTVTAKYGAVNGLMLNRMLGDSATAAGVHTCATHATTAKPSITIYREGYAATEKKQASGCVSKQLQLVMNQRDGLQVHESFTPITDSVSTATPADSAFPTSQSDLFDIHKAFTINAASYTLEEINWNIAHNLKPFGNNAGKIRGIIDSEPIVTTLVANVKGDITALRTLKGLTTAHNVVWTCGCSLDSTKYITINASGFIYDIQDKHFKNDPVDRAVVSWVCYISSAPVKDGVADAFYGD